MANSKQHIANTKKLRGFTLIELLVAIAIIGILSSILMVNLSGFRERTRDTTRKKDLRTIQTALELYRADTSSYPASLPSCGTDISNGGVAYLKKLPCDPVTGSKYNYTTPGSGYEIYACLENIHDSEKDTNKGSCSKAKFTVESP